MQPLVAGDRGERGVGAGERLGGVAAVHRVGDQHHVRGHAGRGLGEHAAGHLERGGLVRGGLAGAVVERRLQRAGLGVGGREVVGALRRGGRGGEVLRAERQRGELAVRREAVAVLVDQQHVLAERALGLALVAQQPGEGEPGLGVLAVQAEHVAELDHRPVGVAGGDVVEAALVMRLGAGLLAFAAAEREGGDEQERRDEDAGTGGHRALRGQAARRFGWPRRAQDSQDNPRGKPQSG